MYHFINDVKVNSLVIDATGEREKVAKDAPVAVILHGGLSDNLSSYYFSIVPELLRIGMQVILYDRAGHGRSGYKPGCFHVNHTYSELDQLLLLKGVNQRVHVIGCSLGAGLAAGYVATRPERCSSLLLLEGCPLTHECKRDFSDYICFARDNINAFIEHYRLNVGLTDSVISRIRRMVLDTTYLSDMEESEVLNDQQLSAIGVPTLGIYGGRSDHGSYGRTMKSIGQLPNVQTRVIPDGTHFLIYDSLPTVNHMLREFYVGSLDLAARQ